LPCKVREGEKRKERLGCRLTISRSADQESQAGKRKELGEIERKKKGGGERSLLFGSDCGKLKERKRKRGVRFLL